VCVGDARSVQQQVSGRLQSVYVRGEVMLRAHTIVRVRVRVYCVCQEIHTYTATHPIENVACAMSSGATM